MKLPDIDLDELKRFKKQNFKERLRFIKEYADWMKSKPSKEWSRQQREVVD